MSVQTTDTITPLSGGMTGSQQSASAWLTNLLGVYGLSSLGDWAWNQYLAGHSPDQIMIDIRQTPEYKARFPAMEQLAKAGNAITETDYINYEQGLKQLTKAAGLPVGMYDTPDQVAKMLTSNVSLNEAKSRLDLATTAVLTAPTSVRQALHASTGLSMGDLTAYYLDSDKALPVLQQQYAAAQITGAGIEQGLNVKQQTAMDLAQQGITYGQAQQGLGAVAATQALGGGFGETASQDTRIGAQFGNTAAQTQVGRVVKGRLAQQAGGGGAAASQAGLVGLSTRTP